MKVKDWAIVIAGAGLIVWLVFTIIPAAIDVDTVTVDRGDVIVTVQDDGKTRVKDLYVVYAPVTGYLHRIEKEVGDSVMAGQTILASMSAGTASFLDSRTVESAAASVQAARSALEAAQSTMQALDAEVSFAGSEIKRIQQLYAKGTVSMVALDQANLKHEQAVANQQAGRSLVNVKQAELKRAESALSSPLMVQVKNDAPLLELKAPVSGVVLNVDHESAGIVSAGTPLVSVGNASDIEIVADFLSTSAVKVHSGARVFVEGWGGAPLFGKVRLVEPTGFLKVSALGIEEQRVNIIIDFDDAATAFSKLGHGFKVEPKIIIEQQSNQIRVPIGSLFRTDGNWGVFKIVEGRAILSTVKLGASNTDYAVVLDGIQEGDVIIMHPSDQIENSVRVTVKE